MDKYKEYFSELHTNTQKGVKAPHKAIMLLSVIDLVEYGVITSNRIEFSERLEQQFQHNWSRYVGQSDVFQPRVGTPFWHLNNEPFWRLVPYEGGDEAIGCIGSTCRYITIPILYGRGGGFRYDTTFACKVLYRSCFNRHLGERNNTSA